MLWMHACPGTPNLKKTNWRLEKHEPKLGLALNSIKQYLIFRENHWYFSWKIYYHIYIQILPSDRRLKRLDRYRNRKYRSVWLSKMITNTPLPCWRIKVKCHIDCNLKWFKKYVCVCVYGVHYTMLSIFLKFDIFETKKLKNVSLTNR